MIHVRAIAGQIIAFLRGEVPFEPADASSSCLQTRNLTLVFDPNEKPPTLVAAVYDQWEW